MIPTLFSRTQIFKSSRFQVIPYNEHLPSVLQVKLEDSQSCPIPPSLQVQMHVQVNVLLPSFPRRPQPLHAAFPHPSRHSPSLSATTGSLAAKVPVTFTKPTFSPDSSHLNRPCHAILLSPTPPFLEGEFWYALKLRRVRQ